MNYVYKIDLFLMYIWSKVVKGFLLDPFVGRHMVLLSIAVPLPGSRNFSFVGRHFSTLLYLLKWCNFNPDISSTCTYNGTTMIEPNPNTQDLITELIDCWVSWTVSNQTIISIIVPSLVLPQNTWIWGAVFCCLLVNRRFFEHYYLLNLRTILN